MRRRRHEVLRVVAADSRFMSKELKIGESDIRLLTAAIYVSTAPPAQPDCRLRHATVIVHLKTFWPLMECRIMITAIMKRLVV
jgi:hypothetical protein